MPVIEGLALFGLMYKMTELETCGEERCAHVVGAAAALRRGEAPHTVQLLTLDLNFKIAIFYS